MITNLPSNYLKWTNPYEGEADGLKLNHWLQQLEVYLNMCNPCDKHKIDFSILKIKCHA